MSEFKETTVKQRVAAGLATLTVGLLAGTGEAAPIYVTTNGVDSAGNNWSTPTSLTNALAIATNGSEIWLAQGIYSNNATFTVQTNCMLYGGFTNGMASPGERNWTNYPTVLDGQGLNRRVVTVTGTNVTLDGLIVSNSSGAAAGGILKTGGGNLTLANCRLVNHVGITGMGGYFTAGSVLMTNCVVASNTYNSYNSYGLGIYSVGANLQLVDCLFTNNNSTGDARSAKGAALYFDNGTLNVFRTDFIKNTGCLGQDGGGAAVYLGANANLSAGFSNCVFRGNVTQYYVLPGYGGAMWVNLAAGRTATVVNCTFKDNLNDNGHGGAIYISSGTLVVKNSILWTNAVHVGFTGREIYNAGGAVVQISYSCLGGLDSTSLYAVAASGLSNVMTNDPLYADATDLHVQSSAGRWANGAFVTTDTAYSPCIDAGDLASAYSLEATPHGSRVNLGAYGNTDQASKSPTAPPQVADRGMGFVDYTKATISGELVNASAVIAEVGVCYGTNSVAGDTTNGWQYVGRIYPPQQTGSVFSVTTPYLLTNTTYYYRWYTTNGYGDNWTSVSNFTTGSAYPPGWGVGGGSNVIHVNRTAVGAANGQNWFDAYTTVADGCTAASGTRTNVWIAGGVYAEAGTIAIATNLTMLGGFAGTETNATDRNWTNYPTVLDGQGLNRRVVTVTGTNVTLDGLIVSNSSGTVAGGIVKAVGGSLTLANCRLVNHVGISGMGGYFTAGSVLMTNCVVAGNTYSSYNAYGLGIRSEGANLQLVDCLFTNNYNTGDSRGFKGTALYFDNGTLNVFRTDFIKNTGGNGQWGGGAAVYLGANANLSAGFSNCVFRGNVTPYYVDPGYGGAMWLNLAVGRTATVVNCTFRDNLNDNGHGGAIYIGAGTLVVKNSILWTNAVHVGFTGREIYNAGGAVVQISYSCLGGLDSTSLYAVAASGLSNVMTNNPLYADATDLHLQSPAGRWANGAFVTTDTAYSPCIDAGDLASAYSLEATPHGSRVNLGAYGNTDQASKSPTAPPQVADHGMVFVDYTKATISGELVNASAVIADVGVCYGTNSVAGDTTNGWQYVGRIYPPQQTGSVFSVTTPYLLTNTTYYYRWYATNGYGGNWTTVSNVTTGSAYPPGWGVSGGSNVIHVNKAAVGAGNGENWFDAYTTVADGCAAAGGARTNMWIAGGVYAEAGTIAIATNLTMLGGFTGTETNAADRNWTNYPTILNGQGLNRRVVTVTGTNVTLDGLIVSNSSGAAAGGILKTGGGSLTLANCRLVNHVGITGMGGYFTAGSVLMTNCLLAGNTYNSYNSYGLGIYSVGANLQLVDCLFTNNNSTGDARSAKGAALYFDNGTLGVLRTHFVNNTGCLGQDGGAAVYLGNTVTASSFSNCVFRGNVTQYYILPGYGGAMWVNLAAGRTATVVNCTFKDNLNDNGHGGAIYISSGTLVVKDSILWTNSVHSGFTGREIYANSTNSSVIGSYTCMADTSAPYVVGTNSAAVQWGAGVITNDPLFVSATDVHLKSQGGRWNPLTATWVNDLITSPCIDAGDPASAYANEPEPSGHRVNLGAYGNTTQASKTRLLGILFVVR